MAKNDPEYARAFDRARRAAVQRLLEDPKIKGKYRGLLREEMEAQGFTLRRSN